MKKKVWSFLYFLLLLFLIFFLALSTSVVELRETTISVVALGSFLFSLIFFISRPVSFPKVPFLFFVLFLLASALSGIFSVAPEVTLWEILRLLTYFSFFVLSFNLSLQFKERFWMITAFYGLGFLVLISSFGYHLVRGEFLNPFFRLSLPLGWPNLMAGFLILFLPLGLALFLASKKRVGKFFFGVTSLLFFLGLILTYSRGGWLSFLLIIPLFFFLSPTKINLKKINKKTLLFLILMLIALVAFLGQKQMIGKRFLSIIDEFFVSTRTTSGNWRLNLYRAGWQMFLENWRLGLGPGTFGVVYPFYELSPWIYSKFAHNYFLQVAAETGLLGLVFFGGLFMAFFSFIFKVARKRQVKSSWEKWLLTGLALSLLASFFHNLVDIDWGYPALATPFWVVAGIFMAMSVSDEEMIKLSSKVGKVVMVIIFSFAIILAFYLWESNQKFLKARHALEEGKVEKAIDDLEKVVSFFPFSSGYYSFLGSAYQADGAEAEAEREYQRSIKLNRYASEPLFLLASLAWSRKDLDGVEQYLRQAIKLTPYQKLAYYRSLGEVLIAKGEEEEAEAILKEALFERFPLNQTYQDFQYLYNYTQVNEELWQTSILLGTVLKGQGKEEEAQKLIERLEEAGVRRE